MTLKAFKYRFYPTPEQETLLRRTMGCTRLVYNPALAARTEPWTVSLLVDAQIAPLPKSPNLIGIDLGITNLVVLSTGEHVVNPQGFRAKRAKLRRAQKAISRKQKGSNNRYKASLKAAKVHEEISDSRRDFLHKLTTRLVRENGSPGYPVIDIAYVSQGKDFSDFITKALCFSIHFPPQIQESPFDPLLEVLECFYSQSKSPIVDRLLNRRPFA